MSIARCAIGSLRALGTSYPGRDDDLGFATTYAVLAAAYWPARRAAHVDPVTALRGD